MIKYFATLLVMFFVAWPIFAADLNGYTAQYECRAGNSNCPVDVVTYSARACDQNIAVSTAWASINWSNNTICLEAGDHTAKGTLTIPSTAAGTEGNYKVLRYYRSGDTNDEPWNQASPATIKRLVVNTNYWIVHRIRVNGQTGDNEILGGGNILNRMLVENSNGANVIAVVLGGSNDNWFQNGVVRTTSKNPGADQNCIAITGRNYVINNELYDCTDGVQAWQNGPGAVAGTVVENNDFYTTAAYDSGPTESCVENGLDWKTGGTLANPAKILHNRIWNFKANDTGCSATGAAGDAIAMNAQVSGDVSYVLIQNNIVLSSYRGITTPNLGANHLSIIGNLIYNIDSPFEPGPAMDMGACSDCETNLNTVISAERAAWLDTNADFRCNVMIDIANAVSGTDSSGAQKDYNVYYNATNSGEINNISKTLNTRTNSTAYFLNAILRSATNGSCVNGTEEACFLYKVTVAGTSAGSAPSYCTTLGCTQTDGTLQVQAVRGPYVFKRKLRTVAGGETAVIPYARAHSSTPENGYCPSTTSNRPGVGVNG